MTNNTNKNLLMLIEKYGCPEIDFFPQHGGTWRLWFTGFHQHRGSGSHGFLADGSSIEEAIMRLYESAKKHPPQHGEFCERGCPEHTEDLC